MYPNNSVWVELSGIDFVWKVVLLVAKPVPGFCYCIGNHKSTIPQPVPGCKQNDLKSTIKLRRDYIQNGMKKLNTDLTPQTWTHTGAMPIRMDVSANSTIKSTFPNIMAPNKKSPEYYSRLCKSTRSGTWTHTTAMVIRTDVPTIPIIIATTSSNQHFQTSFHKQKKPRILFEAL